MQAVSVSVENVVLDILEQVGGTRQVRDDLDLALFDQHILDSFDMMQVIFELSDALQIEISPAEVEREAWSTPRTIIANVQQRLAA